MRVVVLALGSRGDVQPYIALGKGLQAAGHDVRVVSHENFEGLVQAQNLDFWPVQGDVQAFAQSPEMQSRLEKGNFISVMRYAAKEAERAAINWAEEGLEACRERDLLLAGFGGMFIGLALAEKLGLPMLQAHYVPFTPTHAFPGALFPPAVARLGGAANRISHHLTRQIMWQQIRSSDTAARRQVLGSPAAPFWGPYDARPLRDTPVLYGFSPAVIPKPADWGTDIHVTGYWFLESESGWTPPADLAAFLRDGPPPIYIGFGSMSSRRPEETGQLVLQAVERTGQRAILHTGWQGLNVAARTENILMIDAIPHDWLFPRVKAVVHHGGAGTTAAGLRAGVPSVIIPFFADQPFWGQRVFELGVGPKPIARQKLTVENLSRAIETAVSDQNMQANAMQIGERIRAEDGVGQAVAVIERFEKDGYQSSLSENIFNG